MTVSSLGATPLTEIALTVSFTDAREETVKDETYAIQRPFVLVTVEGKALSKAAQKFFDYITSGEANEIISAAGVVPAN